MKNNTEGYFGINSGNMYRTTDSGVIWRLVRTPLSGSVNDIEFGLNNSVYISGQNGMLMNSTDNGVSWTRDSIGTTKDLIDIHVLKNSNIMYVSSNDGEVYKKGILTSTQFISHPTTKLNVYPNPASEFITINSKDKLEKITIFNLLGEVVLESINTKINISKLKHGSYYIRTESALSSSSIKFIKN